MRYEPVENMLEKYPALQHHPELTPKRKDADKLLRFCMYLCDSDSPIFSISDEEKFVVEAAKLADIDPNSAKGKELIKLDGSDKVLDAMIECVFALLNNPRYESWFTQRMNRLFIMRELRKAPSGDIAEIDKRLKIQKAVDEMDGQLEMKSNKLFRNSTVRGAVERSSTYRMLHYPETFAEEKTPI